MIVVKIEYREATFKDEHFTDVLVVTEAITGSVFEEEQSSVIMCANQLGASMTARMTSLSRSKSPRKTSITTSKFSLSSSRPRSDSF